MNLDLELVPLPAATGDRATVPRHLAVVAGFTVLLLLVGSAGNVAVNPRNSFPWQPFTPIIADDAENRLEVYRGLNYTPEAFIFGTSRAGALGTEVLDGRPAFLYAIKGSNMADASLAYEFVVREQGVPALVVLSVDQFLATTSFRSEIKHSRTYETYLGHEPPLGHWIDLYADAFTLTYSAETAAVLQHHFIGSNGGGIRDADIDLESRLSRYKYSEKIKGLIGDAFGPGATVEADRLQGVDRWIERAVSAGSEVWLLMPPFQGDVLAELTNGSWPAFDEAVQTLHDRLVTHCGPGVRVFDYTDAATFGGDGFLFKDQYHMHPDLGQHVLQSMEAGTGEQCQR